ncbi:class I SAM-dependent methyltransferase [Enterococcus cecorum]
MVKILDVCCGTKMFWYDKREKHTTYMDIRKEIVTFKDRNKDRISEIDPDIVGDFRKIPFDANTFDLVVFDPPHLIKGGETSWIVKKYGKLDVDSWQEDLKRGFEECLRVLKPTGVLLFKWNDDQIKFSDVLKVFEKKPILGDRRSKTKWSVFIKG